LGALIRGKPVSELGDDVLTNVLNQCILLAQKKLSLLKLATPFICTILSGLTAAQWEKIDIRPFQDLFSEYEKKHSSSILQMCLAANLNSIELEPGMLNKMEDICTVVATDMKSDNECIELLFTYLQSSDRWKEFWSTVVGKLGHYDFELFITCLEKSLEKGCPLKTLIQRDIVVTLLGAFRVKNSGFHDSAVSAFRLLLNWCPKTCTMSSSERKSSLKVLFEDTPNVLTEYGALHATLRQFTTYLSPKELTIVTKICLNLLKSPSNGNRVASSTIAFLSRVTQARNISEDTRIEVAKHFFVEGFCNPKTSADLNGEGDAGVEQEKSNEEGNPVRKRISREAFEAICRNVFSKTFLDGLLPFVESIATDKGDNVLLNQVPSEVILSLF